ncbi:MAG: hypothetical protein ACTSQC_10845 [Candidatus Heimdallarchaeaceae archaeon]
MTILSKTIKLEMEATFKMLNVAVTKIDGDYWKEVHNNWMYGYTLFHILEALDFHYNNSPEDWVPMTEISALSEEEGKQRIQTKDRLFFEDYLTKVQKKVSESLEKFNDQELLEEDDFASKGFSCRIHKFSYVMRHAMSHVGELSKTAKDHNMNNIKWQKLSD